LPDAITASGDIVGLYEVGDGKGYGFHRHNGVFRRISYPGSVRTVARGINTQGDIVGRFVLADSKSQGYILRSRR
jgi:hypothetical protein